MGPRLAVAVLVLTAFGATGCRLGNDRTATVAEPSSGAVESDATADEPASRPESATSSAGRSSSSTVLVTPAELTRSLSDEEIADLEQQLDEIDRLLSDAERAFTDD